MSTEVSAGDTDDVAWGGYSRSLEEHLLFDVPARAPGEQVTLSGTLSTGPRKKVLKRWGAVGGKLVNRGPGIVNPLLEPVAQLPVPGSQLTGF